MKDFMFQKVLITCNDLFHDRNGCAFRKFLMLFDEAVKGSFGTILKNKIQKMIFFDDMVAFDDIWMI